MRKKRQFTIEFLPSEGDPAVAIAELLSESVSSVLTKHNASIKVNLIDIIRNHIKVVK